MKAQPRRVRVLVAADQGFRALCVANLEIDGLAEVAEASDCEQMLSQAASNLTPDLIVLGPQLAERTGWQCLVDLRSLQETSHIPVILFAETDEQAEHVLRVLLADAGLAADRYVVTPFDRFVLVSAIQDLMSSIRREVTAEPVSPVSWVRQSPPTKRRAPVGSGDA